MSDPDLWPCHSGVLGFSTVIAHITTADFVSNDLFSLPRPLAGGHSSSGRSAPQPSCSCGCLSVSVSVQPAGTRAAWCSIPRAPRAPRAPAACPPGAGHPGACWLRVGAMGAPLPTPSRAEPTCRAPGASPAAGGCRFLLRGQRAPLPGRSSRAQQGRAWLFWGRHHGVAGGRLPALCPPAPRQAGAQAEGGLAGGGCGRRWPGLKGVRGALFRAMVPLFARCGDIWASLLPCRGPGPLAHRSSVILQKTTQLFWELKRPNTQRVLRGGALRLAGSAQERAVFKESGTLP